LVKLKGGNSATEHRDSVKVLFDGKGTAPARPVSDGTIKAESELAKELVEKDSWAIDNANTRQNYQPALGSLEAKMEANIWSPWEQVWASLSVPGMAPVFVTCTYNKGRSGHELKDVATPFILGAMFGWTPCTGMWWSTKPVKMFNPGFGLTDCETYGKKYDMPPLEMRLNTTKVERITVRNPTYDGMDFEQLTALQTRVTKASKAAVPGTVILLVLQGSTRVHMHQAYNWRIDGKLPHAVFEPVRRALQIRWYAHMNRVAHQIGKVEAVPTIPYLFGGDRCRGNTNRSAMCVEWSPDPADNMTDELYKHAPEPHRGISVIVAAAHFRRGDVAHMSKGNFSSKAFAQRMANDLRNILGNCNGELAINIHTERQGNADLVKNPGLKNITKLYFKESWEHDMMGFANADILVVTNSSMSTWAAMFGKGLTILPSGNVKHFGFTPLPSNLIPYTTLTGPTDLNLPIEWLSARGCPTGDKAAIATSEKSRFQFGAWQ
jgi:hypothetical protein